MSTLPRVVVLAACSYLPLAAQVATQAQIVLEVEGSHPSDKFGEPGLAPLRDVDGDGVGDFAVAGYRWSTGVGGHVSAYSGATGAPLWHYLTASTYRLTGGGDVNGDGILDLLFGTVGYVRVLSGADGAVIRTHVSSGLGFGMQPPGAIFGDANGDGFDDYLIADNIGGTAVGVGYVIDGRTGNTLYTMPGQASRSAHWSSGLGDVDGDGLDDYVVAEIACGAQFGYCNGSIAVHSGATGLILHKHVGYSLGHAVQLAGPRCGGEDIDGDGISDFVVSGYVGQSGLVQAVSGATGDIIWERAGSGSSDSLGSSASIGDDWDGDGHADVLVTVSSVGPTWRMLSGADGTDLQSTPIPIPQLWFGGDAYLFEDLDGDGSREVLSRGGRQNPFWLPQHPWSVFLTRHASGPLSYQQEFGHGCAAGNGNMPRASMRRDPRLGTDAQVRLRGTVPGSIPVLVLGVPLPPGVDFEWTTGCHLYVNPVTAFALPPTDANGLAGVDLPVPNVPAFAGIKLALQWFVLDGAANGSGVIGSSAVRMVLGS